VNAALLAGMLSAALADAPIWELNTLPGKEICLNNAKIAEEEACRFSKMLSMSPSRASIITPALKDALDRKELWETIHMARVCYDPPRIPSDWDNGPRYIQRIKDALGEDAFIRRNWPAPKLFP
jgi:hypothetical protein